MCDELITRMTLNNVIGDRCDKFKVYEKSYQDVIRKDEDNRKPLPDDIFYDIIQIRGHWRPPWKKKGKKWKKYFGHEEVMGSYKIKNYPNSKKPTFKVTYTDPDNNMKTYDLNIPITSQVNRDILKDHLIFFRVPKDVLEQDQEEAGEEEAEGGDDHEENTEEVGVDIGEGIKVTSKVSLYISDANIIANNITGEVDLIYMDPPYETNRDFTLDSKSNKVGFSDKWENNDYETWLSILVSTLKKTLTNKGTLVIHISSENSFTVEKVLRETFKNIEKIYWKRCHGKNTVKKKFGAVIDILFVAYDIHRIFNPVTIPIEDNSIWAFKNSDERGAYSLGSLRQDRTRKGNEYTIVHKGVEYISKYGWKQNKETVEELISKNRIHFVPKSNNMYVKGYKHEHTGKPLSNIWDDIHSITRNKKDPRLYPTQKPQKLLERIIQIFSNENSLVLDPVCGSGTTGYVADKMNRRCIMVDANKEVSDIIRKRFKDNKCNI